MKAAEVVQPIGDRILVKALEKRPTFRGHVMAKVISVGTGSRIGKRIVYPNLKAGEVLVFHVPAGAAVRIGKADYYVLRGDDVLKVNRKALSIKLSGPPGSGKSFAAMVLANELAAKSLATETRLKLHTKRAGLLSRNWRNRYRIYRLSSTHPTSILMGVARLNYWVRTKKTT